MPRFSRGSVLAGDHVSREILAAFSFRFAGARCGRPQVAEFEAQGLAGDPQEQGGLVLTPAGVVDDARQKETAQVAVRRRVDVADVGVQPQADQGSSSNGWTPYPSRNCGTRLDNETWPVDVESDNLSGRHHHKVKR
jgi:hypothetical protein